MKQFLQRIVAVIYIKLENWLWHHAIIQHGPTFTVRPRRAFVVLNTNQDTRRERALQTMISPLIPTDATFDYSCNPPERSEWLKMARIQKMKSPAYGKRWLAQPPRHSSLPQAREYIPFEVVANETCLYSGSFHPLERKVQG